MGKSKIEIIDETVEYIQKHGRALGRYKDPFGDGMKENACTYRTTNAHGKVIGCAVGRVIRESAYSENLEGYTVDDFEEGGSIDHLLKPEYHGHEHIFWSDLQNLHDSGSYWDETDHLTEKGEDMVANLKERYSE